MTKTITITSKGQTTLPVAIRRKLGLDKAGGVLNIRFNEHNGELIISKAADAAELSNRLSRHIRPGTTPLTAVDEYYQKNRKLDS